MGAAGDLRPDQCRFRVEGVGVDPFQIVPAHVVIAVAGGGGKAGGPHPVFLHGGQNLSLIVLRNGIGLTEAVLQGLQDPLAAVVDLCRDAQTGIQILHGFSSFSYKICRPLYHMFPVLVKKGVAPRTRFRGGLSAAPDGTVYSSPQEAPLSKILEKGNKIFTKIF